MTPLTPPHPIQSNPVHWNDLYILQLAGKNPEVVQALLARHDQAEEKPGGEVMPTPDAVYQWWSRKKIPDEWRSRLVYALFAEMRLEPSDLFRLGNGARKQTKASTR